MDTEKKRGRPRKDNTVEGDEDKTQNPEYFGEDNEEEDEYREKYEKAIPSNPLKNGEVNLLPGEKVAIFLCSDNHRTKGKILNLIDKNQIIQCYHCTKMAKIEGYYNNPKYGKFMRI
jgi:hypothetical protein